MARYTVYCPLLFALLYSSLAVLDKNIGERCSNTADCKWAYSYCANSQTCVCRKGFSQTQQGETTKCEPEKLYCPHIVVAGVEVEQVVGNQCTIIHDMYQYSKLTFGTCGPEEYCFPYVNSFTSDKNTHMGHCCPKPPSLARIGNACPLSPIYNGSCPDQSIYGGGAPVPADLAPFCPLGSHECVSNPFCSLHNDECNSILIKKNEFCCPNPCIGRNYDLNIMGQCYERSYFNRECLHDSQCPHKSVCRLSTTGKKTCQCPEDTTYEEGATACHPY